MIAFLSVIHVIVSILMITSILLQASRGGGLAGMFGGGGMGGVFGGRGAASFLSKVTMWLAVGFAVTSLTIAFLSSGRGSVAKSAVQEVMERDAQPTDILPTIPSTDEPVTENAPETE